MSGPEPAPACPLTPPEDFAPDPETAAVLIAETVDVPLEEEDEDRDRSRP